MTYAENIAFYFYCIYVPYKIVMRGVELALNALFYGAIILLMLTLIVQNWELSYEEIEGTISDKVDEIIDPATQEIVKEQVKEKTNWLFIRIGATATTNISLMWKAIESSAVFKKVFDILDLPLN